MIGHSQCQFDNLSMFIQNASSGLIIQFNRVKSKEIMNTSNFLDAERRIIRKDNPHITHQNPKQNKLIFQSTYTGEVKKFPAYFESSAGKSSKEHSTSDTPKDSPRKITGLQFAKDKILEPSNVQPLGFGIKKSSPSDPAKASGKNRRGSHDCVNGSDNQIFASQICQKSGGTPKLGLESMARPVATEPDNEIDSPLKKYKHSVLNFKNLEPPNQSMIKTGTINFSNLQKKQNSVSINSPIKVTNNLDYIRTKKSTIATNYHRSNSDRSDMSGGSQHIFQISSPVKIGGEFTVKSCQQISSPSPSPISQGKSVTSIPPLIFRKKTQNSREETKCSSARLATSSDQGYSPSKLRRRPLCKEDFMIGKKLGNGRYGDVFAAKHKQLGFICAMKIVSKKLIKEENIEDQFARELKIQCYLKHANVATMYGYFDDKDHVYLLLEICSDGHLMKILKSVERGRLPQEKVKQIIQQICQGVEYLHRQHILHRDIKPENIIIHEGLYKLCDFGWARYTQNQLSQTFCGSPLYVSPEILKGELYDAKIDIWSVGILTYEMLFGKTPFKINTKQDLGRIITDEFTFPEYVQVSDEAKDFITCILKKNPEERFDINQLLDHSFLRSTIKDNHKSEFIFHL